MRSNRFIESFLFAIGQPKFIVGGGKLGVERQRLPLHNDGVFILFVHTIDNTQAEIDHRVVGVQLQFFPVYLPGLVEASLSVICLSQLFIGDKHPRIKRYRLFPSGNCDVKPTLFNAFKSIGIILFCRQLFRKLDRLFFYCLLAGHFRFLTRLVYCVNPFRRLILAAAAEG